MERIDNLIEWFEPQQEDMVDEYGYTHKHFTPLVTALSNEKVKMLFCGVELTLLPDGTYFLDDTTGG